MQSFKATPFQLVRTILLFLFLGLDQFLLSLLDTPGFFPDGLSFYQILNHVWFRMLLMIGDVSLFWAYGERYVWKREAVTSDTYDRRLRWGVRISILFHILFYLFCAPLFVFCYYVMRMSME